MRKIFKKSIAAILSAAMMICQVTAFDVNVEAAAAVNLLTNGDFTDGMTGWNTYFYSGNCASAKITDDFEYDMTVNYWDQWSWDGNEYYKIDVTLDGIVTEVKLLYP